MAEHEDALPGVFGRPDGLHKSVIIPKSVLALVWRSACQVCAELFYGLVVDAIFLCESQRDHAGAEHLSCPNTFTKLTITCCNKCPDQIRPLGSHVRPFVLTPFHTVEDQHR